MLGSDSPITSTSLRLGLLDCFRRTGNRGRGDGHHELHLRIDLQDGLCLREGFVPIVVARPDGGERQAGILLRDSLFDESNPFILIGCAERAGNDRERLPFRSRAAPLRL